MNFYIKLAAVCFVFLGILYAVYWEEIGLRINRSHSLHHSAYLSFPIKNLERGDYISFYHPNFNDKLAKRVTGISGDEIFIDNNHIYVNGVDCGEFKEKSTSGRYLTPLSRRIIPEGYVFVSGSNENSFDSRYEELGLVKISWIKETLWPLF